MWIFLLLAAGLFMGWSLGTNDAANAFGTAVAKELAENGMEIIAVDIEQRIVNDAAAYLPVCKCADVTDSEVISRLGIGNIDTVIVCMASKLEASVMAITLCKEAGVETVIVKCGNEMHQKILTLSQNVQTKCNKKYCSAWVRTRWSSPKRNRACALQRIF